MQELPVTIIVLCFNASSTIIDTLQSIKQQNYNKISLLIGDDASKDNSVEIANQWIEENRDRFIECDIICHSKNVGTSKNFDDLMKRVNTEWVKVIAADDTLINECISKNVNYIVKNDIKAMLYSRVRPFKENKSIKEYLPENLSDIQYAKDLSKKEPLKQYKSLLRRDIVFSPTGFINANIYKKLGGIDIRIRNIEDWPLRLLFTKNGYRVDFMDEVTVNYRIGDSVSHSTGCFFNPNHIKQRMELKKLLVYPNISKCNLVYFWDEMITSFRYNVIIHLFKNKVNTMSKIANYLLMMLSPSAWKKMIEHFTT